MKVTLWCIFTLIISLTSNEHHAVAQNTRYKVVIVGAGLSGYSAAAKLLENEIDDILVLEAEDRIGGRIHSIPFANGIVDMGAQWLHGQEGNLIYEMIDGNFDFGDDSFENATDYFLLSNGAAVNRIQLGGLVNLSQIIRSNIYDPNYYGTYGSYFLSNYLRELRTPEYAIIPWNLAVQVQNFYHSRINTYYGSKSWFDISIAVYATEGSTSGNQYVTWKDQGFVNVFDFISRRRPDPSQDLDVDRKILLNKEVVNVNWDGDVTTLRCSDDTEYSADYVIFTPSLGVLKARHASLFTPRLPDTKVLAFEHSEYGSLEKIFLEFESPFWDTTDNFADYSILWTQNDISDLVGTDQEWLTEIAFFSRVEAFPNLLQTFFIGARIPNFENFTDNKIIADCMWLLRRLVNQPTLPDAIRAIRSDWITKRNFLGSYSLFTMDSAYHGVFPSKLAEPVHNADGRPRIFFAGEHTSALFSGYSNGAVETGFRAGEEVLEYIESGSSKSLSKNLILVIFMLLPAFLKL